jgi:hypothetical protein
MENWLRCRVYPGQFSVEYAVVVRQSDGSDASLFVPQEFVECSPSPSFDRPTDGLLRVQLIERQGQLALVRLPRSTLEHGDYVTVQAAQLEARPQRQPA